MKLKEFMKLFSHRHCDGIIIVNNVDDDFTNGNVVDCIYDEKFYEGIHTTDDFKSIYGDDREIIAFGLYCGGCGGVYLKICLQDVSSDYDANKFCFVVTVDNRKYISHLHDDDNWKWTRNIFELIENI